MSSLFWNTLRLSPIILATSLLLADSASATEAPVVAALTPNSSVAATSQTIASLEPAASSVQLLTKSNTPAIAETTSKVELAKLLQTNTQKQNNKVEVLAQVTSVSQLSNQAPNRLAQVTSVSQLSDVQPTDWAFQALQSLVERYGCIVGYPDSTYRGNRALTRYEFAAGLNSCLDRVNELIAASTTDLVRREDLATLQRLQEEFGTELATLRGRVDALEAATAELEANQFSTTTKLNGEVVIALTDTFGDGLNRSGNTTGQDFDSETVLQGRARLNFDTSFTGRDQLRVRLQAANFTPLNYLDNITYEGRQSFAIGGNLNNQFVLSDLFYQFPIGESVVVHLLVAGGEFDDYLNIVDPLLTASGTGATGSFAYNPIYNVGGNVGNITSAGLGLDFKLTDKLAINLGYLGGEGNSPTPGSGIFNGDNSFLARAEYVDKSFQIAAVYLHSYNGADTTFNSNEMGSIRSILTGVNSPVVANSYGVEASFAPFSGIRLGAWGGYSNAIVLGTGRADVWNYAATLTFPDFGKEGNLLGFVVGMEPKLTGTTGFTVQGRRGDPDVGIHVEGFYRYQLTNNISITPGVIWLTNPNHDANNDDILVGTLRTTFQF